MPDITPDIQASNNRRIAKNAIMLYIRMLVAVLIGLYTSRVLLDALGAEDFGLYNVVGGVVAFLAFINGAQASATSRFLAYEIGTHNTKKLRKTFAAALIVHFLLGFIIVLVAETLGFWFLTTKLVIPPSRLSDAIIVYHFSVFATFLGVLVVPFSAAVIAHEKMGAYALIEIINVVLKLIAVIVLQLIDCDNKIVLYSALITLNGILIFATYTAFSKLRFKEVSLKPQWDSTIIKPLVSFSSYSLFSSGSVVGKQQGITFIINIFFGVVVNAANAIVTSVAAIVTMLSESVCNAFRPQVVKLYAANQITKMETMINTAISISMPISILVASIIIYNRQHILELWLISVPKYTSDFLVFILIENTFSMLRINLNMGITATGKIKRLSIWYGLNLLLVLPFSYVVLRFCLLSPFVIFCFSLLSGILGVVISLYLLTKEIKDYPIFSVIREIVKLMVTSVMVVLGLSIMSKLIIMPVLNVIISTVLIFLIVFCLTYIQMPDSQKTIIKNMLSLHVGTKTN